MPKPWLKLTLASFGANKERGIIKGGVAIKELNVGSMAHSEGKVVVNKAISMNADDIKTFEELKKLGVAFDVRKVPSDSRENMDDLLKKAAAGLR